MITDGATFLGDGASNAPFSLSAKTATTHYTNSRDLGYLRDIGEGLDLYMVFSFPKAVITTGAAGSIQFDPILTSDGSSGNILVLGTSGVIGTTSSATTTGVPEKSVYAFKLGPLSTLMTRIAGAANTPYAGKNTFLRQYIQARIVVGTTQLATDAAMLCHIDIVTDVQSYQKAYPSGFTVA